MGLLGDYIGHALLELAGMGDHEIDSEPVKLEGGDNMGCLVGRMGIEG